MSYDQDFHLHVVFDPDSYQTLEESPVSYVIRARPREASETDSDRWYAVKSASTRLEFSKKPHDILKELRILQSISHWNIIEIVGHGWESITSAVYFWMPFIPHDLFTLLSTPEFSPHTHPGLPAPPPARKVSEFIILAKSITYQVLRGVAYLHDHRIAHRDIKPRNILITEGGCIKLIDFGIAWTDAEDLARDAFWPEPPGHMVFDVATGPYRAPELLFGAHTYDAFATDLWSLGAVFAEFFTSLRLEKQYDDHEESGYQSDGEDSDEPQKPFNVPSGLSLNSPDTAWVRDSLFDASMGTIGLAWSIFKTMGTPTDELWPEFNDLPDADKVSFRVVPAVPLENLLPNLPPTSNSTGMHAAAPSLSCLDLLHSLLRFSSAKRMRASSAMKLPWFTEGFPLLLPTDNYADNLVSHAVSNWEGQSLCDLLSSLLSASNHNKQINHDSLAL